MGIAKARGGVLLFIDADDVIHPDILRQSVERMCATNADTVLFGVSMNILSDEDGMVCSKTEFLPDSAIYSCETFEQIVHGPLRYMFGAPLSDMEDYLYRDRYKYMRFAWVYCWLYRASIISEYQIRFREDLTLREDGIFNCEYLIHANRIDCIPEIGYEYNKRSDGAASTLSKKSDIQNKIALVRYRSLIGEYVYQRGKIDISEWAYGSYALSVLQLCVALSDEKGGYAKLKSYLKLDDVKKAIKGAPLKGNLKITAPLFFAKIGCTRLMYSGVKVFKKFIKI